MTGVDPRGSTDTSSRMRTYQAESASESARQFEQDAEEAAEAGFYPVSHSWEGTGLTVTYHLRSGPALTSKQEVAPPASTTRQGEELIVKSRPSDPTSRRAGDPDVRRDEETADAVAQRVALEMAGTSHEQAHSSTAPSEMYYGRRSRATTPAATPPRAAVASAIEPVRQPLSCAYPGCDQTTRLELCAVDGRRLVCPAHRMLVEGSYLCATCRERFEDEEYRAYANSRHWMLLMASITTLVLGLVALWITLDGGDRDAPARMGGWEWPLVAVLIAAPIVTMWRSGGFKRGTLDQRSGLERLAYWLVTVPAILGAVILFVSISVITTWLEREYRINTGAEAVKRGIERYARRY